MKLTIAQVTDLLEAHKALDGFDRVVKDGATEKIVKQPYEIGFGFSLLIAENVEALTDVVKRFNKERDKRVLKYSGGETSLQLPAGSDAAKAFSKEMLEASEVLHDVDLHLIDFNELKGDVNKYPPSVLAGLMPVRKKAAGLVEASRGPKAAA
jgi:hypothetical protein